MDILYAVLELLSGIIIYLLVGTIFVIFRFKDVRYEIFNWPIRFINQLSTWYFKVRMLYHERSQSRNSSPKDSGSD
jgi:hypothetical protein